MSALFPLGKVCITPGALEAVKTEAGVEFPGLWIFGLLERHQSGDWGEVGENDRKENLFSVDHKLRILSAYTLPTTQVKIWIITEADRSVTTLLLPSEY